MKLLAISCTLLTFACAAITAAAQVTTSQYDNLRTGASLSETILSPQSVNVKQFGRLGAFKVDGAVYAQPLFIPSLEIPGKGTHDVLFVATEHDSVYAFNVDRPNDHRYGTSVCWIKGGVIRLFTHGTCNAPSSSRKLASLPRR